MRDQRDYFVFPTAFVLVVAAALGCDTEGEMEPRSSSTAGGDGSSSSSGSSSSGSSSSSSGLSSVDEGVQATDFVSTGNTVKSGQYTLVFTMGQSTQNHQRAQSPRNTLSGGLVGTTQSLK